MKSCDSHLFVQASLIHNSIHIFDTIWPQEDCIATGALLSDVVDGGAKLVVQVRRLLEGGPLRGSPPVMMLVILPTMMLVILPTLIMMLIVIRNSLFFSFWPEPDASATRRLSMGMAGGARDPPRKAVGGAPSHA